MPKHSLDLFVKEVQNSQIQIGFNFKACHFTVKKVQSMIQGSKFDDLFFKELKHLLRVLLNRDTSLIRIINFNFVSLSTSYVTIGQGISTFQDLIEFTHLKEVLYHDFEL